MSGILRIQKGRSQSGKYLRPGQTCANNRQSLAWRPASAMIPRASWRRSPIRATIRKPLLIRRRDWSARLRTRS